VKEQLQNGIQSSLENVKPLNAKAVSEAAQEGDWLGIAALSRAANYVGIALANLLHVFNPTAIIIGGGVSRSGPLLLTPMFSTMQSHVMNPRYLENLVLREAKFGDDAGLMGALALARTSFPGQPR
jgi:glucokinase